MKHSALFGDFLRAAQTKRYPFSLGEGRVLAAVEFLAGGSWVGGDDHHTAFMEFGMPVLPQRKSGRGAWLREAAVIVRETESFLCASLGKAALEYSGREVEGSVRGTWILRSAQWNSTVSLSITRRPRKLYLVLSMTESR